jgi:hypothetical protein
MTTGRTPKTGILRQWVLMPEKKKFVVVGVLAVACFLSLRSVFTPKPEATFQLRHSLSPGVWPHRTRPHCYPRAAVAAPLAPLLVPACCIAVARGRPLQAGGVIACAHGVVVGGVCADEKESLRLQIIKDAEAEHAAELAKLREEHLRAQALLRYVHVVHTCMRGCIAPRRARARAHGRCRLTGRW